MSTVKKTCRPQTQLVPVPSFLMPTRKVTAHSGKKQAASGVSTKRKQTQKRKPAPRNQKQKRNASRRNKDTDSEPPEPDSEVEEQEEDEDSQPRKKARRLNESEVEEVGGDTDDKSSSEVEVHASEEGREDSEVKSVRKQGSMVLNVPRRANRTMVLRSGTECRLLSRSTAKKTWRKISY
jgi:hypothetical protein